VVVGWSKHFTPFLKDFFGIVLPEQWCEAPLDCVNGHIVTTANFVNIPAILLVWVITMLLIVGIKESARFNNFMVAIKVTIILLIIGLGWGYINWDNHTPFIPDNTGKAGDGLLPPAFAKVHLKSGTPHITTMITGFRCSLLAGFLPLNLLGELVSIGTLLAFTVVCIGVIILRKTRPDMPRPYRTPLVPWVPAPARSSAWRKPCRCPRTPGCGCSYGWRSAWWFTSATAASTAA
jgi:amino acid transporter